MNHFDHQLHYDDDMNVLKFLVHTVPGLLPVSGTAAELAIDEPDLDLY